MSILTQTLEPIERYKALWDAAQPLPASLLTSLREDWEVTQTYNSNAIEGNTLTLAANDGDTNDFNEFIAQITLQSLETMVAVVA